MMTVTTKGFVPQPGKGVAANVSLDDILVSALENTHARVSFILQILTNKYGCFIVIKLRQWSLA